MGNAASSSDSWMCHDSSIFDEIDRGQKIFLTQGSQGHVYSTVALRISQEDRRVEMSDHRYPE